MTPQSMAEMFTGGSLEQKQTVAIGQSYTMAAVMLLLDIVVKQSDDPAFTAKQILDALYQTTSLQIKDEIDKLKIFRETDMGKIFGGMLPKPEEFAAGLQDRLNGVHAKYAKFLLRNFEMPTPDEEP